MSWDHDRMIRLPLLCDGLGVRSSGPVFAAAVVSVAIQRVNQTNGRGGPVCYAPFGLPGSAVVNSSILYPSIRLHSFIHCFLTILSFLTDLCLANWVLTVSCTYDFTLWHSILLLLVLGTPLAKVLFLFSYSNEGFHLWQFLLTFLLTLVVNWLLDWIWSRFICILLSMQILHG